MGVCGGIVRFRFNLGSRGVGTVLELLLLKLSETDGLGKGDALKGLYFSAFFGSRPDTKKLM